MATTADGVVDAVHDLNDVITPHDPLLDEHVKEILEMKGAVSENAAKFLSFRDTLRELRAASLDGNGKRVVDLQKELKTSWTALGQVVGHVLLSIAEEEQKKLQQEIAENAKNISAQNAAFAANFPTLRRIGDREIKIGRSISKLLETRSRAYVCASQCADAPGFGPIGARDGAVDAAHYSEVLKKYAPQIPAFTKTIGDAETQLVASLKSQRATVSVSPPINVPAGTMKATYRIGACPYTEGAQFAWRDARSQQVKGSFAAERGAETIRLFPAPAEPDDYETVLQDSHLRTIAVAPFRVESIAVQPKTGKLAPKSFSFDVFYDGYDEHYQAIPKGQQYRFRVTLTPGYAVGTDGSLSITPSLNSAGITVSKRAIKGPEDGGGGAARTWSEAYAYQNVSSSKAVYDNGEVLEVGNAPNASARRLVGLEITFGGIDSGYNRAPVSGVDKQPDGKMVARLHWETNVPLER